MKKLLTIFALLFATSCFAQAVTNPPVSKSVVPGTLVNIKLVSNDGTPPFVYQWQKNGTDIAGQTATTLTFLSVALTDVGSYTLKVTNIAGQAVSNTASVTIAVAAGNVLIIFSPTP
jgi:Immunoglobulin domain